MRYIKLFSKDADYKSYMVGEGKIYKPNVSYCKEINYVYYNPIKPNKFSGVVSATSTSSSYRLFSDSIVKNDNIKRLLIDGVEVTPVSSTKFSTTGEHTYEVELKEPMTSANKMFQWCSGLISLDLSKWDISNVTNMYCMFHSCHSLKELKMGGNPSNLTNVSLMFYNAPRNGTFYYNSAYDYSKILSVLPSSYTAISCTLVDGVLVPNE